MMDKFVFHWQQVQEIEQDVTFPVAAVDTPLYIDPYTPGTYIDRSTQAWGIGIRKHGL